MTSDEHVTAAAGWCAPSETVYALRDENLRDLFPKITLPPRPGTPAYEEQQARIRAQAETEQSLQRYVHRHIRNVTRLQDEALARVYVAALQTGHDVLLQGPPHGHTMWRWNQHAAPPYRFIGLALIARSTDTWRTLQGDRPIIIRETAADYYDDDEWGTP